MLNLFKIFPDQAASSRLGVLGYDSVMAKNDPPFEVTCPCCSAVLKVDAEIKGVIARAASSMSANISASPRRCGR